MHKTLHILFQMGISREVLVQSIRNIDFINHQETSYLNIQKLLTYNKEPTHYGVMNHFISFYSRVIAFQVSHFVNHVISIYQVNRQHVTNKMASSKFRYDEVQLSYGLLSIVM